MNNIKMAGLLEKVQKECLSTNGQCSFNCLLYDPFKHTCKLASSDLGEPREWNIVVRASRHDEMVDGEVVNADVDPETGELPGQKEWTA